MNPQKITKLSNRLVILLNDFTAKEVLHIPWFKDANAGAGIAKHSANEYFPDEVIHSRWKHPLAMGYTELQRTESRFELNSWQESDVSEHCLLIMRKVWPG